MSVYGSLSTLGVAELLQVMALFRKMGSLRLKFPRGRTITIYFQNSYVSGLTDTERVWQLADLLFCMGRLQAADKQRLLIGAKTHGIRLGQLLLNEGRVSRLEVESLLRRLNMQSLLFAGENESRGEFELQIGPVSETSIMFPITDFLMEITSALDELRRLREILGRGGEGLMVNPDYNLSDTYNALSYRHAQVLAHIADGRTPMEVAGAASLSPTETLRILCELAAKGIIYWTTHRTAADTEGISAVSG